MEVHPVNNKKRLSNKDSDLYRAILELKTPQECYEFFSDLCTVAELKAMEQRFEIARMLMQGMIYNDILEKPAPAAPPSAVSTAASTSVWTPTRSSLPVWTARKSPRRTRRHERL